MSDTCYQITPNRFIYHVTSRETRDSINKLGLLPFSKFLGWKKEAVYANNGCKPDWNWFPFNLDYWWEMPVKDYGEDEFEFEFYDWISKYDIWQIDTHAIENEWYTDIFEKEYIEPCLHILTFDKVDRKALKLFKTERGVEMFREGDGVAHCYYTGKFKEQKLFPVKR